MYLGRMVPEIIDGKRFRDGVAVAEIDGLKRRGWNDGNPIANRRPHFLAAALSRYFARASAAAI